MANTIVVEAIASSSAHGISRAAATKLVPLRIMWTLLFLACLALFLKDGVKLLIKLSGNKVTKEYHLDETPFRFPDLYFCPSNPYSGSFPYLLSKKEADFINSEVLRLIERAENVTSKSQSVGDRIFSVHESLPFYIIANYLTVRNEQSVWTKYAVGDSGWEGLEILSFYNYEGLICFNLSLTDAVRKDLTTDNDFLEIWLSTDPFFVDFNFTGHPIDRVKDEDGNSMDLFDYHPRLGSLDMKSSGFIMVIVPPGTYPFMAYEKNFRLAPGNAYYVNLKMEMNTCSQEIHGRNCMLDPPNVEIMNPLTEKKEIFSYSKAACLTDRRDTIYTDLLGCRLETYQPLLWKHRHWPGCSNYSEQSALGHAEKELAEKKYAEKISNMHSNISEYCRSRIPCSYPKYKADFSFEKWPSAGSAIEYFAKDYEVNFTLAPALATLSKIAKQLQAKNHTSHMESLFRSYVSESLIRVSISVPFSVSSNVILTWSYSFTACLADMGGLLGLYIGCSVLTVCELLELIFIGLRAACLRGRGKQQEPMGAAATANGDGAEMGEIRDEQ